jgi:hypothetical protein
MSPNWLLFASIHSCLDSSGGAALAMRELLELLSPCESTEDQRGPSNFLLDTNRKVD